MNGFIIRQVGEIEVNGPDGVERINGLLLEGDVSHIRLAAVWFGERVSVAPIGSPSPSPSQVAPANLAQVTDAMVEVATKELLAHGEFSSIPGNNEPNARIAARAALTAAIGAGGQAVALEKRPVAFRVKDFADGWILFHDEEKALAEADATGALMQGLYARDCSSLSQPHPADERVVEALRKARQLVDIATDWNLDEVEIDGEMVKTHSLGSEFDTVLEALSTKEGR